MQRNVNENCGVHRLLVLSIKVGGMNHFGITLEESIGDGLQGSFQLILR